MSISIITFTARRGTSRSFAKFIAVAAAALPLLLTACSSSRGTSPPQAKAQAQEIPVTTPPAPHSSGPNPAIVSALQCIEGTGLLHNTHFAIAVHADGTGKATSGYDGATGSILPQGTSAIWAAQAVMFAGGIAQNYYELNTERALRQFGGGTVEKELSDRNIADQPEFVISTAFTALDFLGGPEVDLRVAGIGPQLQTRGASLEVSAEVYRPGDRTTLAISSLSRQIKYNYQGINVASGSQPFGSTLVTGAISWTDQQRIQEASRDLIALSVADILSRVPGSNAGCRAQVEALLQGQQPLPEAGAEAQPPAAKPRSRLTRAERESVQMN